MVFACGATLVCLLLLFGLALLYGRVHGAAAIETNDITVTGISLVAAWSWEHCFNTAFDVSPYDNTQQNVLLQETRLAPSKEPPDASSFSETHVSPATTTEP